MKVIKNNKSKVITLDLEIYPREVWLIFNPTVEEIDRLFEPRHTSNLYISDTAIASTLSLVRKSNNKLGELIVFFKSDEVDSSIIAHEALHATFDICNDVGITLSADNQEPIAYLLQYIVGFIDKELKLYQNDKR